MDRYRIAIDIGNTNVHCAIIDTLKLKCLKREQFLSNYLHKKIQPTIEDLLTGFSEPISECIISSTIKQALVDTAKILKNIPKITIVKFHYGDHLPIKIEYQNPNLLGLDRIAHALFANAFAPTENVIVICAGSAITIDLITKGNVFEGGAIMPGIAMQLKALHQFTDALPLLPVPTILNENSKDQSSNHPIEPIGKATQECMYSGVIHGTIGALVNLVNQYKSSKEKYRIVCTGGDWNLLKQFFPKKSEHIPDLTLIGVGLFPKK